MVHIDTSSTSSRIKILGPFAFEVLQRRSSDVLPLLCHGREVMLVCVRVHDLESLHLPALGTDEVIPFKRAINIDMF